MTVLMQLILLQDWQRVLIRARLFGNEVNQACTIQFLFGGDVKYRVLPLHVACALDPPHQVVEALLQQQRSSSYDDPNKKKKKKKTKKANQKNWLQDDDDDDDAEQRDDEEQRIEHIPPLSLAAVPVEHVQKKKKKRKSHNNKSSATTKRSWKRASKRHSKHPDDQEELLVHPQGSSSTTTEGYDAECCMLESHLASNGSVSGNTNLYAYSVEAATVDLPPGKGAFSPENSIGDTDSANDESFYSTVDDFSTTGSDTSPIFEDTSMDDDDDDDENVEVLETESSLLGSFLEKQGVVLQLTASGNIQPLPLSSNEAPSKPSNPDEWSTIDPKPSGASSSITHTLSQQSSMFSAESTNGCPSITFDLNQFLQCQEEAGKLGQLLAIHIACLYQASPATLQILLNAYPEGALTAVHGMLPIHLVAANWKLPSIPLASNPYAGVAYHTPSGVSSSMIYSQLTTHRDPSTSKAGKDKRDRLQVFIEAVPESLLAKSVCHDLRPVEYVQYLLDSKHPNSMGRGEETPLFFLENCEKEYHHHKRSKSMYKSRYVPFVI
jgi:hypothetical protein